MSGQTLRAQLGHAAPLGESLHVRDMGAGARAAVARLESRLGAHLKGLGHVIAASEVAVHPTLAFCGGISGAYAFMARGGNLGAAQTSNLIELMLDGLSGNFEDLLVRLLILGLYATSIVCAYFLNLRLANGRRPLCIVIELAFALAAGSIPAAVNPLLALCPVFCMSAFQWVVFTDLNHYNSSTIFSTNNLKQVVVSTMEYLRTRDDAQRRRAIFFLRTLVVFHLGVVVGYFACTAWDARGIWAVIPVLALVLVRETAALVAENMRN